MSKPLQITWDEQAHAATNARAYLPALVADYFARGRKRLAHNPRPADLHALRLATKRLRYTLELFRPCYGPGLKTRIDTLRDLQQFLGDINDTVAAAATVAKVRAAKSPQRTQIENFLRKRGAAKAGEFHKHWNEVFDATGREQWWIDYLARYARVAAKAAR